MINDGGQGALAVGADAAELHEITADRPSSLIAPARSRYTPVGTIDCKIERISALPPTQRRVAISCSPPHPIG